MHGRLLKSFEFANNGLGDLNKASIFVSRKSGKIKLDKLEKGYMIAIVVDNVGNQ
jgi:hypothetical protein